MSKACSGCEIIDINSIVDTINDFCGSGSKNLSFAPDINIFKGGFLQSSSFCSNYISIIKLLYSIGVKNDPINLINFFNKSNSKPLSRSKLLFSDGSKVSLSIINNNFIVSHYNPADLSMLSDFDELKTKLSVVSKSFVTLGKPLKFGNTYVYVRYTMLLTPGSIKSLKEVGKLYGKDGEYSKVDISFDDVNNMDKLLERDRYYGVFGYMGDYGGDLG